MRISTSFKFDGFADEPVEVQEMSLNGFIDAGRIIWHGYFRRHSQVLPDGNGNIA